jgi:hypothetical protein
MRELPRSSASTTTSWSRRTSGRRGCQRSGERGPKVERKKWGDFKLTPGAHYVMNEDPDGTWGDAWYLDGKLIYVQKRFVAIRQGDTRRRPVEVDPYG